ncbi:hypothetical protein MO486_16330 [Lysobacter sp. CFH 32150]|nr:hypothetical protein [Lysobacter sp. CFH 32150]
MQINITLLLGVALLAIGLWLRLRRINPADRAPYLLRVAFWVASIVLVAWPLRQLRPAIGSLAYLGVSLIVLGLFFWFGILASKRLTRPKQ